ncbi:PilZ domain-containing protein [Acidobacteriota bacterium]
MNDFKNGKERREFPRFEIPVQIRPTEVFGKEGRVANISMSGVRIFGTKKIEVGKILKIEFVLPSDKWVTAVAQVIWAKEQSSQSILKYDFGCRFVEVPSESKKNLFEYLSQDILPED